MQNNTKDEFSRPKELKQQLSLVAITLYGVGLIVGAGIYSILGAASAKAGESLWLSFVIAAAVAALTGFSYAELSSAIPKSAAEFSYLEKAFPKFKSFRLIVGLLLTLAAVATATTVALAFGSYFQLFFEVPKLVVAFVLILLMSFLTAYGLREATWVNIFFTLLELSGLLLIIYFGFSLKGFARQVMTIPSVGVLPGASLIFFAYLGFEDIANLSEEIKDPAKNLSRAIFWSIGITSLLYVLVAVSVLNLVPLQEIASVENPLAVAALKVSPFFEKLLSLIALGATLNTVLVSIIVSSRMLYGMSKAASLPLFLSKLSHQRHSPYVAVWITAVLALCLLPLKAVSFVGTLSAWASLIGFAAVNAANIRLRKVDAGLHRPFRLRPNIKNVPVVSVLGFFSCLFLFLQIEGKVHLAGIIVMSLLWLFFLFSKKMKFHKSH